MLNSAANHHLYADDTQLPVSFSALNFSHDITELENTIANVSIIITINIFDDAPWNVLQLPVF